MNVSPEKIEELGGELSYKMMNFLQEYFGVDMDADVAYGVLSCAFAASASFVLTKAKNEEAAEQCLMETVEMTLGTRQERLRNETPRN